MNAGVWKERDEASVKGGAQNGGPRDLAFQRLSITVGKSPEEGGAPLPARLTHRTGDRALCLPASTTNTTRILPPEESEILFLPSPLPIPFLLQSRPTSPHPTPPPS